MPGNKIGGKKAAATNVKLYGDRFYQRIGRKGGQIGRGGGFAANPELARIAGAKGGRRSKRGANSLENTRIKPHEEGIRNLYNEGYSIPEIAKRFRLPADTLRKWANKNIAEYSEPWGEE